MRSGLGSGLRWLILLLSAAVSLAGCASDDDPPPSVEIRVEHLPSVHLFRVTYQTSFDARALVFTRGRENFRSRGWITRIPGQRFEHRLGREVLTAQSAAKNFEITIPESATDLTGDYPLITDFSDGSTILYTGHLDAIPIACAEACTDGDIQGKAAKAPAVHLTLVPAKGERVLAGGVQSQSPLSWNPPAEGSFSYFGNLTQIRQQGYSVVMDPELPGWILPEVEKYLPLIIDLHRRRFGRAPSVPPVILIPYLGSERRGSSTYSGAVVGSQMVLSLFGGNWFKRTDESREEFLKLLAHETFHFWNSSIFHSVDVAGGSWLHEGSADAFAYLALLDVGAINEIRYGELQTEALNRCLVGLSGTDLPSSSRSGGVRNHYECGAMIEQLVSLASKKKGFDLWDLWKRIFAVAQNNGGFYTHEDFFKVASELTDGSSIVRAIRSLTSGEVKGVDDRTQLTLESYFVGAFASVGVGLLTTENRWPEWYRRLLAEKALAAVVEADCGADGYLLPLQDKARLVGGPGCRNLKEDRELKMIGRYSLWMDGVQIYEMIHDSCRDQPTFVLPTRSRSSGIEFACPRLPRRPLFLLFPDYNAFD